MITKKCASRIVLTLLMACATAHAQDNRHYEVLEWCFCKGVDMAQKAPIDCLSDPAEAKGTDKIYLWTRISVNANGIRYLCGLNKLPIYHAWGRNGSIEGSLIDIGLDSRTWQDAKGGIEEEIRLRHGTFDWRTYSEKVAYIHDGQHYVSILDAQKRPVVLSREPHTAFRPSIRISVREE